MMLLAAHVTTSSTIYLVNNAGVIVKMCVCCVLDYYLNNSLKKLCLFFVLPLIYVLPAKDGEAFDKSMAI